MVKLDKPAISNYIQSSRTDFNKDTNRIKPKKFKMIYPANTKAKKAGKLPNFQNDLKDLQKSVSQ